MQLNKITRIKMVKAMEFIARQVNDEDVFEHWLMYGVADGDIAYGNLNVEVDDEDNLEYYIRDQEFSELMDDFLTVMSDACKSGGLYCDDIVSGEEDS